MIFLGTETCEQWIIILNNWCFNCFIVKLFNTKVRVELSLALGYLIKAKNLERPGAI